MPMRPCWVEIDTQALADNYRFLAAQAAPDVELLAIVKANAYGHGLQLAAPTLAAAGARWLGVTSVEEAIGARTLCPQASILVIGGLFPGQGREVHLHRLTPVVWEPWQLRELEDSAPPDAPPLAVHLEIDTGMSRQGVDPEELSSLLHRFMPGARLELQAVMTHLFAADEADGQITDAQLTELAQALEVVFASGLSPTLLNVGNSAALASGQAHRVATLAHRRGMRALMRPGLALYGLLPAFDPPFAPYEPPTLAAARRSLRPVLSWKSQVATVRTVQPGTVVGYNGTFVATEPMRLALIPAGYADGLRRSLGNRFHFLVRGGRAPLVGRVSMDQSVLDVTEIAGVQPGDEVVLLGAQGAESISAEDHAQAASTIPWEIFTSIGHRVPRLAR